MNQYVAGFVFVLLALFGTNAPVQADPQLTSWLTEPSGRYARVYETDADQIAGNAVTSWIHPTGGAGQAQPTYAGVHEISTTRHNRVLVTERGQERLLPVHEYGPCLAIGL